MNDSIVIGLRVPRSLVAAIDAEADKINANTYPSRVTRAAIIRDTVARRFEEKLQPVAADASTQPTRRAG